jgi:glycosyltransferase involved in cell wall biosynthesis
MLLNPDIYQLFILNDLVSVNHLNKNHNTSVFKLLVDPIKKRNIPLKDFRCGLQINKSDIVFLSLGGISHRKNIHTILKALDLLPENVLDRLKLIISGKTHDSEYALGIKKLINKKLIDKVIFLNHFLEIDELESLVCFSDALLTVYVDFYSSSGVVGNASKYHKPLIAANTGVIGRITNEFSLGLTVNPNSANEISDAITQLVYDQISVTANAQFEAYNTRNYYIKFAEQFLTEAYV